MKKTTKAIGGIALAGILGALAVDLVNKDARGLEILNDRAGLAVDCKIRRHLGERWGVCRYLNGATASVWLQREGVWISANGNALELLERLAKVPAEQLQGLPEVSQDRARPPSMPDEILRQG
jgi:hypothetical protein